METITKNQMDALLTLLKDRTQQYNSHNLSKKLGLTHMGTLKILKNLEKKDLLVPEKLGKAVFYRPNLNNSYAGSYLKFLLESEAEQSAPRVKRWVKELRKLDDFAEIGILFGSLLRKEDFKDVDVMLVLKESQNKKAEKKISELDKINVKKIHAVKQTKKDLVRNIRQKDKVVLNILKQGVVLFGYEKLIKVLEDVSY